MNSSAQVSFAGATAVALAGLILIIEIGLAVAPLPPSGDTRGIRSQEPTEQDQRRFRFQTGLIVLLLGSVPTGAAALAANRSGADGAKVATAAGACWVACVAAWLVLAGLAYTSDGPRDPNDRMLQPTVE